jgi:hypothetical protein
MEEKEEKSVGRAFVDKLEAQEEGLGPNFVAKVEGEQPSFVAVVRPFLLLCALLLERERSVFVSFLCPFLNVFGFLSLFERFAPEPEPPLKG